MKDPAYWDERAKTMARQAEREREEYERRRNKPHNLDVWLIRKDHANSLSPADRAFVEETANRLSPPNKREQRRLDAIAAYTTRKPG